MFTMTLDKTIVIRAMYFCQTLSDYETSSFEPGFIESHFNLESYVECKERYVDRDVVRVTSLLLVRLVQTPDPEFPQWVFLPLFRTLAYYQRSALSFRIAVLILSSAGSVSEINNTSSGSILRRVCSPLVSSMSMPRVHRPCATKTHCPT